MNLFRKKSTGYFYKEEEIVDLDQYHKIPDSEEIVPAVTSSGVQGKSLYYPNPALFRRLIEGTSFDHRRKIEAEQKTAKIDEEQIRNIYLKKELETEKIHDFKRDANKISAAPSTNRKKFIKKEGENRLGNIVHEVLGYPVTKEQDS